MRLARTCDCQTRWRAHQCGVCRPLSFLSHSQSQEHGLRPRPNHLPPPMSSTTSGLVHILRRQRDKSVLDRYGLVRNFFLRQASTSAIGTRPAPRTSLVLSLWTRRRETTPRLLADTWSCRVNAGGIAGRFQFHTSARIAEERQPEHGTPHQTTNDLADVSGKPSNSSKPPPLDPRQYENYPKLFRRLAMSLPHLQRPTRDDFLNAATGFWQRVRIRFKWLTIRSFRRYNADDMSAFITWFFMSQTLWLFVGT